MTGAARALTDSCPRRAIVLDREQEAAITSPGNLVVRAGAGSGKTEVLARRFVALVVGDLTGRAPLSPAALAAITFTERAALDLRKRIGVVLAERIIAENGMAESTAERRLHLSRAQRILALARISTIHAFCARILRENAIAAGLDLDFEVLDEYESDTFFERVCGQTIVDAVRAGGPGALFLLRARRLHGSPNREGALEIVQRIFTEGRRAGHKADWILQHTERAQNCAQNGNAVAGYAEELVRLIDELLEFPGTKRSTIEPLTWLWPTARPAVLKLDESATRAEIGILREVREALPDARGSLGPRIREIRALVDRDTTNFGLCGSLVAAWGERRAAAQATAVARLIARVGADFDAAQRDERALTFDDLLICARDLLRNHPEVAARYRDELRAILVDEYQDTNGVQDEVVSLLTALPAGGEGPELFIVGDEKQSIYRFRGADVRVFNLPRTPDPHHLPLSGNRRSTPNILNFVNGLGAAAMRAKEQPCPPFRIDWNPGHALAVRRATEFDYPVEIIAAIDDSLGTSGIESAEEITEARLAVKPRAGEKRQLEARAIANRIGRLVASGEPIIDPLDGGPRPVEYRDIVVLFRAFSDIALYEDALSDAAMPCYTVQGRGFFGRREVIDLVALLAAVDDARDSLRLAAALRSPFFALSDNCLMKLGLRLHDRSAAPRFTSLAEIFAAALPDFSRMDLTELGGERDSVERAWRVLRELRELRGQLATPAIVERALDLTDYESVMAGLGQGRQRIANLRKVVELAHRFDARRFFTFHDFVAYLRRLTEAEPYEPQAQILGEMDNVVRLMTVHQAKGLEFSVVILADIGRGPNTENRTPLLDPERGLLIRDTDGSGADEIPNAALDAYRDRLRDEEDAESVRILYVAVTRARDRLIVSEGAGIGGWSKHLRSFIGGDAWVRLASAGGASVELECNGARVLLGHADTDALAEARCAPERAGESASCVKNSVDAHSAEDSADLARRRLSFTAESTGDLMISPTALADFDRCPRQYWLRHGLGLPERSFGRIGDGAKAAALGLVAHEVLERVQFGAGPGRVAAEIAELAERLGVAAGLTAEQCADLGRDLLRYAAAPRASETVVGREIAFMLNAAPSFFVRGQIDLIARAGDTLIVRDYKYSTAVDARRYQIQLECYALAAATAYPGLAIVAQIVALRDNPEPIDVPLPAVEAIRARLAALGEQLAAARRNDDYPRKPPNAAACHALGCGYVARCWGH